MFKWLQIAVVGLVVASSCSFAAPKAKQKTAQEPQKTERVWDKEPDSVFGIKLGGLVSELPLPTCPPKSRSGIYETGQSPVDLCVLASPYFPEKYAELYGTPKLGVEYWATMSYYKGRVSSITLNLRHENFEAMKSVLVERYGPPSKTEAMTVTAGNGAKLTSQTIVWDGKGVSITAIERFDKIDRSIVSFSDLGISAIISSDKKESAKEAAEKL